MTVGHMSVRITTIADGEQVALQIAGRLQSRDLPDLDGEIRSADAPLVLDLSELQSADAEAVARLRELRGGNVKLDAASPYVQLLLDASDSADDQVIHSRPP